MSSVQHAKDAAEALCRLNNFGAIQALCESGLFPGNTIYFETSVNKIIKICKTQMQVELTRYDNSLLKAQKGQS